MTADRPYPPGMALRDLRPRVRRIRRDGDPAVGVVAAVEGGTGRHLTLTLAVKLPGGDETTIRRAVAAADVGDRVVEPGVTLPVRYDRAHPERVEVDLDALRRRASTSAAPPS